MLNKIFSQSDAATVVIPKHGLPGNTKPDHILKWDGLLEALTILNPTHTGRIIDLGCGQHNFPIILHDKGYEVYCVENHRLSNDVINHKNITHCKGDVFTYLESFPDDFFDFATDGCSIIHFDTNSNQIWNDGCARIGRLLRQKLKPDGKLIMCSDILKTTSWDQLNSGEFLYMYSLMQSLSDGLISKEDGDIYGLSGLYLYQEKYPELISDPYTFEYNKQDLSVCRLVFEK